MGRSRHRVMGKVPARNINLACGHPEGQAQLHRDELTAWCYNCEADVEVTKIPDEEFLRQLEADDA